MQQKTFVWDEINSTIFLYEKTTGKVFAYAEVYKIFWKTTIVQFEDRNALFENKKDAMVEIEEQLRLHHMTAGKKPKIAGFSKDRIDAWEDWEEGD